MSLCLCVAAYTGIYIQDLEGVEWLQQYLTSSTVSSEMIVLVTSHDKDFMDNICTDIIRFAHQQLNYYPGRQGFPQCCCCRSITPS